MEVSSATSVSTLVPGEGAATSGGVALGHCGGGYLFIRDNRGDFYQGSIRAGVGRSRWGVNRGGGINDGQSRDVGCPPPKGSVQG